MARHRRAKLDGPVGWRAAVAGCVLNTWSFGVFYSFATALREMSEEFDTELSSVGAVFGLTTFWFFGFGLLAGPLADRFGARPLIAAGAVCIGSGLILTSRVDSIGLAYLTYGLGVGTGIGLYLVPITVAVRGWFDKKAATALGITTAGIGLGTLALVPAANAVINSQGWRDAFLYMGVGSIVVYLLAAAAIRRPPAPANAATGDREHLGSVVRRVSFWRLYGSGLLMSIALFAPFVYLVDYAELRGVSTTLAPILISVLGVGSVLGRLGIGPLAERIGVLPLVVLSFAVQPVAYLVWLGDGDTYALMVVFAALLGVGYGGYVALSPVAAAELFGLQGLGRVLGVLYTSAGLGALIGPWALGKVIETAGYDTMILLSVGIAGLATSVVIPLWHEGQHTAATPRRRVKRPIAGPQPLVFDLTPAEPGDEVTIDLTDQSFVTAGS